MLEMETIPISFQMLLTIFSASANRVPINAAVYAVFAAISFLARTMDVPEWKVFALFAAITAWLGHH